MSGSPKKTRHPLHPAARVLPPIFKDQGRTYRADACLPVVEAICQGRIGHAALSRGQYPGRPMPRGALPGVRTVGFWDAEQDQDWGLDWHRNEGLELTFLERGTLPFAAEDQRYRLRAGDLTVTRPWQPHRLGEPYLPAGRLHWLILDLGVRRPHQPWKWPPWLMLTPDDRRELTTILRQNEQVVWQGNAGLRRCFESIAQAVQTDRNGSNVSRLTVHLNALFVLLLDHFRSKPMVLDESLTSTRRTVELFWSDLRENVEHLTLEWTVRAMARRCGLGVTHFIHHTKQLANMTPGQYLTRSRLEVASRLLLDEPQRSVTEIALACGFGSSQYFATLFRRHYGVTPREHREQPETHS